MSLWGNIALIIGIPLLFLIGPSLIKILFEKLTGKKFSGSQLNTQVDQSQGRGQGNTMRNTFVGREEEKL